MFSHIMVGSNDLEKSKIFYNALFTAVGGKPGVVDHKGRLVYAHNNNMFIVTKPIDDCAATAGNGCTIGFTMTGPEEVDAWYEAGTATGGTPIEDAPSWRESEGWRIYATHLRDPDGNKLCAFHKG